ncbi:hypothetical protein BGZ65_002772 [Modicella reniformis]|uniref:Uncharacterized protein n=1 Tax=Modicella reniformis TaxID=1440133 RepID=A0A9P6M9J8_9FUNG|nr:hypothetical protein BGZ65_002772 [Modicella reniformis]
MGGRNVVRAVLDSSDDDLDELSRDAGKNALKPDIHRPRHPRAPVADDTIPRSFDIEISPKLSSTSALGSSAKMPWSITKDPEQDIVLSTPVSKRRIRHYNTVLDSEDDLSAVEKSFELSPSSRRRNLTHVHSRHSGLPEIKSLGGGDGRESSPRAIVSDTEPEVGVYDAGLAELEESFATQPSLNERYEAGNDFYVAESQRNLGFHGKSRGSQAYSDRILTRLTKPRPFVLDILSDDYLSQYVADSKGQDAVDVEEEHRKLRKILMFTDDSDQKDLSRMPEPSSQGNPVLGEGRRSSEKAPLIAFPIFNFAGRHSPEKKQEAKLEKDDSKHYPIWRKRSEGEAKRRLSAIATGTERDEEEEEPLEDSRARRRLTQACLRSPPKKIRLTETAPDVSGMESALKTAAEHIRQRASSKFPAPPARMESVESFSTISDSQSVITGALSRTDRLISQVEEIEDFSDEQRSQSNAVF